MSYEVQTKPATKNMQKKGRNSDIQQCWEATRFMIIWLGSSCPVVWCQVSETLELSYNWLIVRIKQTLELSYNWLIVRIKETLESSATIDQLWDQRTAWMKSNQGFGAISDTRMTPEVDSSFNTSDSCCLWHGGG
jgi:hypothetical protein